MTESTPLAISSHSFSISLRSLIAPTICRSPVAIAQPAMNSSSTSAVMPGQAKVRIPTAMPKSPTSASHQRGAGAPPMTASARASTPSASA
jgi:hypothetical protein